MVFPAIHLHGEFVKLSPQEVHRPLQWHACDPAITSTGQGKHGEKLGSHGETTCVTWTIVGLHHFHSQFWFDWRWYGIALAAQEGTWKLDGASQEVSTNKLFRSGFPQIREMLVLGARENHISFLRPFITGLEFVTGFHLAVPFLPPMIKPNWLQ